ncbi:MAG: DUF6035 family protein [Pseudomonadota bacterium]
MHGRNVTKGGLEPADAVQKPKIAEVIDLDDGTYFDAVPFIESHQHQDFMKARNTVLERMKERNPHYACALCTVPVYLVANPKKRFFFRHRIEDGSCPAETRNILTEEQIRARKYHGLRESAPHKRIKELIARSLKCDPAFGPPEQEKTWRSIHDPAAYRRPDVQVDSKQGKLAFEAQLSTTFLSVVVGRRMFYRDEGALLVWIFGSFDPDYRRLMTDDILFPNNSNLFVVDEETATISETRGRFHLRCHYRAPVREASVLRDEWRTEIVAFADVTQDRLGQRAFAYDYDGEEAALRAQIRAESAQVEAERARLDRGDFFEFWCEHGRSFRHTEENRGTWVQLRERVERYGASLPEYPDADAEIRALISALYSVREGAPIGWNYTKLVQVGHLLAESHPRLLLAFGHAVKVYERSAQIAGEDVTEKWSRRMKPVSAAMHRRDPAYLPDPSLLPLLTFLFPEVAEKVRSYLQRLPLAA